MPGRGVGCVTGLSLGRNHGLGAARGQMGAPGAGVVATVGNQAAGTQVGQQLLGGCPVVDLSGREQGAHGAAERIGEQVQLRAQASAAAPEGVGRAVFFEPRPRAGGPESWSSPAAGCPSPRRGPARRPATSPRPRFWPSGQSACTWCASCPKPVATPANGPRCALATARLRQSGDCPAQPAPAGPVRAAPAQPIVPRLIHTAFPFPNLTVHTP